VFSYDPIYNFSMPFNIKAPLGGMFADYLHEYTHWGWVDLDIVMGDMSTMIEDLKNYHIVTYMDGVCLLTNRKLEELNISVGAGHISGWTADCTFQHRLLSAVFRGKLHTREQLGDEDTDSRSQSLVGIFLIHVPHFSIIGSVSGRRSMGFGSPPAIQPSH
jgi:hypothetical protein